MDPGERVTLIRDIAASLRVAEWREIDLVLREFGFPTEESWDGTEADYIIKMVSGAGDEELRRLNAFLNSAPEPGASAPTNPNVWDHQLFPGQRYFRLFISHTHPHKLEVTALKTALFKYGVMGFVAHEDIKPNEEWQRAIESALATCDGLVAYLTTDFSASDWCDQEVGVVFGANKLVVPVRVDINPYGFIGKYQRVNGSGVEPEALARSIMQIIETNSLSRQTYAEVLVDRLCHAYSYNNAREMFSQVSQIPRALWTNEMARRARAAAGTNGELIDGLTGSTTVARAIFDLLEGWDIG